MTRANKKAARRGGAKVAAYERYGIIYKNGKILSPMGWIRELLKKGNSKTGVNVWTYSMLPGTGIYTAVVNGVEYQARGTCACNCVGCYATAGRYKMPSVIKSMLINTYLTNNYIDFVERALSAQIEYNGRVEIRIHAAGDFKTENADEYASMWKRIATRYSVNIYDMWTYTKIKKYETLFNEIRNANIVKSVIPGVGVNFGHCDYIIRAYNTLKAAGKSVYICMCGIDPTRHCENCSVCATYEYVLFIEHSTDYNAAADPLYPTLCEIARNQ